MTKSGIDVSEWQGDIDWSKVRADFVIIRAGYGRELSQRDKKFERNYAGAKSAGIPCGAYWYSYAMSEDEARREAAVCMEVLRGKQFEYPIYLDVEEQKVLALGRDKVSAIIAAFLKELENSGYFAGLYMSAYQLTNLTTDYIKERFAVWVANYDVPKPSYSGSYGMWQKSSKGRIAGISGNVDIDECYADYPKHIIGAGDNGFSEPSAPVKRSISARLTVDGRTYSGTLSEE
ncbi:MAG: glycoside hydrolase family 25 protein [Ruminococcus sp.]|nr:glycoside hydrolase family 25 protein [Ruminococcus sp.]